MNRREAIQALGAGALALGAGRLASAGESRIAVGEPTPGAAAGGTGAGPAEGFKDGEFVLPDLPYAYNALEPHLDEQTMKLHHDIHHAAYVKGANKALGMLKEIRTGAGDAAGAKNWERELAFHGSGHALHTIFWRNMSPKPGLPSDALTKAIERDLGGMEGLKKAFNAASNGVEGSGWGILGYHPLTGGLMIAQAEKHQNLTVQGLQPLLVLDVWEHAYYLKYQNKRAEYVAAFWNVVDWVDISARYASAGGK